MAASLNDQAERFHQLFAELVRRYQFRDRDRICFHGLSVSQCYALQAVEAQGPLAMRALSGQLHLDMSTMTRVVDHLVANKLVTRVADPKDRRVRHVQITRAGRTLASRIRGELLAEYEQVLREIPVEGREAVIQAISLLLTAFKERQPASPRRKTDVHA
ncbi:MAG: MarR family winged helix-turn-helix transcriptional regulator [Planctomycetota bacterium]|jgi:DNA-binding MarR family transcriptional regulator